GLHESLERSKGEIAGKKVEVELASLINDIQIAKSQGLDAREAESYLTKIEGAIQKKNHRQMEDYLRRAKESLARQRRSTVLDTTNLRLQANRWTRMDMQITNKGNWPAEHVTPIVSGPVEILGLKAIERLEPNEKAALEFGLKPKEVGTMDLDFEVHYARPLDDGKHQTTDTAVVRVEPEGGYPIDDALLFHSTGALVAHESRPYLPPEEAARSTNLENLVKAFVNKAFPNGGKGVARTKAEGGLVLATRGPQ